METFKRLQAKTGSREIVREWVADWKAAKQKIVFTNGCFDILHYGHVNLLSRAADLGDKLVVGLNSDGSILVLGKGPSRPIQDQVSRATILSALSFVDAVVIFDEESPYELIRTLSPDVLVKGGDWKPQDIIGNDLVTAGGGVVHSLPLVEGFSTTAIEQRLKHG